VHPCGALVGVTSYADHFVVDGVHKPAVASFGEYTCGTPLEVLDVQLGITRRLDRDVSRFRRCFELQSRPIGGVVDAKGYTPAHRNARGFDRDLDRRLDRTARDHRAGARVPGPAFAVRTQGEGPEASPQGQAEDEELETIVPHARWASMPSIVSAQTGVVL
jgi:hypothetical protein